ncbi:hypothetical protein ACF0H5_016299 [Mactra antiquata]
MIIAISMDIHLISSIFVTLQLAIALPSNLISFIIWTKGKKSKSLACSMYFRLITLTDALSVLNNFCSMWLISYETHQVFSTFMSFFRFFLPSLSTWMMLCISIERYLSLICPFSFRPAGARIRAIIAFVCLILILTGINSYVFIPNVVDSNYVIILAEIASLWSLCIIPFVLINLTNILITIKLCMMKQQRLGQSRQPDHATSFTKIAITSCVLQSISVTPMMMYFLVLRGYVDWLDWKHLDLLASIVFSTLFLNNCFNFFIYYFNSSNFRSDFKEMCCCCCRRNTIHQSNATTIRSTSV